MPNAHISHILYIYIQRTYQAYCTWLVYVQTQHVYTYMICTICVCTKWVMCYKTYILIQYNISQMLKTNNKYYQQIEIKQICRTRVINIAFKKQSSHLFQKSDEFINCLFINLFIFSPFIRNPAKKNITTHSKLLRHKCSHNINIIQFNKSHLYTLDLLHSHICMHIQTLLKKYAPLLNFIYQLIYNLLIPTKQINTLVSKQTGKGNTKKCQQGVNLQWQDVSLPQHDFWRHSINQNHWQFNTSKINAIKRMRCIRTLK
eukprot:TRINITY_DN23645_c0_g1_i2.p1 TRINITY_DN23645_c0_g1~~TRINITY_DN23645_c0_g1_i2.p1  ORF type:complete len:259 (+),score=-37.96 TRINITY_DN23645_c0_g1_i2:247-1023(+)